MMGAFSGGWRLQWRLRPQTNGGTRPSLTKELLESNRTVWAAEGGWISAAVSV